MTTCPLEQRSAAKAAPGRPRINTGTCSARPPWSPAAGSGIGLSLANLLAERGAMVHAADRGRAGADQVAEAIREAGGPAVAHVVDVTDAAAVAGLADQVFADGPVDLLFNNAGIGVAATLLDTTLEDWQRLIDVNLMGVVHGLHAFLRGC